MCEFCHEDREGFMRYLPREGTGNAHVRGAAIEVSGPHHTRLTIPIDFCPKCGRKLKEDV